MSEGTCALAKKNVESQPWSKIEIQGKMAICCVVDVPQFKFFLLYF